MSKKETMSKEEQEWKRQKDKAGQRFRFFKDERLSQPLYIIEFPEPVVRGEDEAELVIYAKNITQEELDQLEFIPQDPDLKIEKSANKIGPFGVVKLKLVFTPSEDRNKVLDCSMMIKGRAIMRGSA